MFLREEEITKNMTVKDCDNSSLLIVEYQIALPNSNILVPRTILQSSHNTIITCVKDDEFIKPSGIILVNSAVDFDINNMKKGK